MHIPAWPFLELESDEAGDGPELLIFTVVPRFGRQHSGEQMTDRPVSFLNANHSTSRGGETSAQDNLHNVLRGWVSACLDDGVQELDTMIMSAPDRLRSEFCCYDVMADEIEIVVQRIWTDIAMKRMRAGH
jgi:hypothetical protein